MKRFFVASFAVALSLAFLPNVFANDPGDTTTVSGNVTLDGNTAVHIAPGDSIITIGELSINAGVRPGNDGVAVNGILDIGSTVSLYASRPEIQEVSLTMTAPFTPTVNIEPAVVGIEPLAATQPVVDSPAPVSSPAFSEIAQAGSASLSADVSIAAQTIPAERSDEHSASAAAVNPEGMAQAESVVQSAGGIDLI